MKKQYLIGLLCSTLALTTEANQRDFDSVMACYNSPDAPGMAVRIEQAGQPVYSNAMGLADLSTKRKLSETDVFQIGSVTKTFTAAAILKLAEQQKLSLQDTLGQFIADINPDYKNVTIEQILSHTAGLPNYLTYPDVTAIWHQFAPIDKVIAAMSKQATITAPAEQYSYSNTGYVLLGKVIEAASGMPYHQFLELTFFKPLKMHNTFVMTQGIHLDLVKGHSSHATAPSQYFLAEQSEERQWRVDRSWIAASGAIASTLSDMSLWQKALTSGEVISKSTFEHMHTRAKLSNNSSINYGLGIDIYPLAGLTSYSHQGMVPGFFTWHVYFPEQQLTATAFTNLDKKHPGPALLDMIALQLNLSPKPVEGKQAVTTAQTLVGRYQSEEQKLLTISYEQGTLYSQYQGEQKRVIVPRENNAYSYQCTENYFQLRHQKDKIELVPVNLYFGEQAPFIKL